MGDLARFKARAVAHTVIAGAGDSTEQGTVGGFNGWMNQLRVRLGNLFGGNPGYGYLPPWRGVGLDSDTEITYLDSNADWTAGAPTNNDRRTLFNESRYRTGATGTKGIRETIPAGVTVHHFDILYTDATGSGAIDVSIDGGPLVTYAGAALGDHDLKFITIHQPVTNTIFIRPNGGAVLVFSGFNLWSRTRPPQDCTLHNGARDGQFLFNFAAIPTTLDWLDMVGPHLLMNGSWTNDMSYLPGGVPITLANYAAAVAAYGTNLQTVIAKAAALATPSDVLIIAPFEQNRAAAGRSTGDDQVIQAAFRQKCIDVAAANAHVDCLNLYDAFGTFAAANAAGLFHDNLHESQAGHDLGADLVYAKITDGIVRSTPRLTAVVKPTTPALLDRTFTGVRADGFVFEVVDSARQLLGSLDVATDQIPIVRNDTTRTSYRTVESLTARNKPSDLDLRRERLRVSMTLQNGDSFPLGIFMFGQDDVQPATRGDGWVPELFDENFILDQGLGRTWSLPKGGSILGFFRAMMNEVLGPLGIPTSYAVADQPAGSPLSFLVSSSRLTAARALAVLLGCYPPFFAGDGTHTLKQAPEPATAVSMDHIYELGARIHDDSTTLTDTTYQAPNRFVVTGDQLGAGVPVRGVYDLPPIAPHSAARVGLVITAPEHNVSGVKTVLMAKHIAYVDSLTYRYAYRTGVFAATADPRHDTFDTFQLIGAPYLETAWQLQCSAGGPHTHQGSGLWL